MGTITQQTTPAGDEIEKIARAVIAEKLGLEPDQFSPKTNFSDDLGVDSLDMIEIFMELERKFEITIQDEEAEKMKTLESIVSFIKKQKLK